MPRTIIRLSATLGLAAIAVAVLTGCAMSKDDAGKYYLSAVCPANAANDTWNDAVQSEDFDKVKAAAQTTIDAERDAATKLEDDSVKWPSNIDESDLKAIADSYYADISGMQAVVTADSIDDVDFGFTQTDAGAAESQRVRNRLSLSSDTEASCKN